LPHLLKIGYPWIKMTLKSIPNVFWTPSKNYISPGPLSPLPRNVQGGLIIKPPPPHMHFLFVVPPNFKNQRQLINLMTRSLNKRNLLYWSNSKLISSKTNIFLSVLNKFYGSFSLTIVNQDHNIIICIKYDASKY
jgi:hypothetical protein